MLVHASAKEGEKIREIKGEREKESKSRNMGGKKVKREERRREREGLDPKLFLPPEHPYPGTARPLLCPTVQGARALGQSWQVLSSGKADQEDRTQDACEAM